MTTPLDIAERSARLKAKHIRRKSVLAAGPHESWRWQLRGRTGEWIEMGSKVKWLTRGRWEHGKVVGSLSPGNAEVERDDNHTVVSLPASYLVLSEPTPPSPEEVTQFLARRTRWKTQDEFRRDVTDTIAQAAHETWPDIKDLSVSDTQSRDSIVIGISGKLPDGSRVTADIQRTWDGEHRVENDHFMLDRKHQGQGFATHVTEDLEDLYRQHGITHVSVQANIDVGGYAWAKRGFHFTHPDRAVPMFLKEIREYYAPTIESPPSEFDQLIQGYDTAVEVDALMARHKRGEEITPLEIAMIGYQPGLQMWPGKEYMLKNGWYGIKHLEPLAQGEFGIAAAAAAGMTTEEFLAEVDKICRAWEPTAVQGAKPDPQYADNDPSQYPENIVMVSAAPADEDRYWKQIQALLRRYRPRAVLAAGPHESWRWQLRDRNGQWIEMGARVKWFHRGMWYYGVVTGSPSPGVADVHVDGDDPGESSSIAVSRLTVRPDISGKMPREPKAEVPVIPETPTWDAETTEMLPPPPSLIAPRNWSKRDEVKKKQQTAEGLLPYLKDVSTEELLATTWDVTDSGRDAPTFYSDSGLRAIVEKQKLASVKWDEVDVVLDKHDWSLRLTGRPAPGDTNVWQRGPESYDVAPWGSPEADEMLRKVAVASLIAQWAVSSNDNSPGSHTIQRAVQKEFHLKDAAAWDWGDDTPVFGTTDQGDMEARVAKIYAKHGDTLRRFVRAQYVQTQKALAAARIKNVTVWRGSTIPPTEHPPKRRDVAEFDLRPLAAFSTDRNVARQFADDMYDWQMNLEGLVIRSTIDARRIFSFPGTGFGCYPESEVVLFGGPLTGEVDLAPLPKGALP